MFLLSALCGACSILKHPVCQLAINKRDIDINVGKRVQVLPSQRKVTGVWRENK